MVAVFGPETNGIVSTNVDYIHEYYGQQILTGLLSCVAGGVESSDGGLQALW